MSNHNIFTQRIILSQANAFFCIPINYKAYKNCFSQCQKKKKKNTQEFSFEAWCTKIFIFQGDWVAQLLSVWLQLTSWMISWFTSSSLCWALCSQHRQLSCQYRAWSFLWIPCLPLSLCPSLIRTASVSLSKINLKNSKKYFKYLFFNEMSEIRTSQVFIYIILCYR